MKICKECGSLYDGDYCEMCRLIKKNNSNMNNNQSNINETPQEKSRRIGVPIIPKLPENQPNYDPNPVVAICGECNREIRQLEGYCCGNPRCPIQPRITC